MKKLLFSLITVVSLLITPESRATGIPVVDLSNLAQNILTAVRALQSNINEVEMIVNQVRQLENDLMNLTALEYSIGDEYSEQLHELFTEMGSVQGLMQDISGLQAKFEELYPDFNREGSAVSSELMSEALNKALDESREMVLGAARTGAMVLENLPRTEAQLDRLLVESEHSVGNLAALQAGNQISATVSANLMNLNALMANYSQAHMGYLQRINTEVAANENRMQQVLRGIDEPPAAKKVRRNPF